MIQKSATITSRMLDYFSRQIEALRETETALSSFSNWKDDGAVERFEREHSVRVKQSRALASEFGSLQHEWDATATVDETERREVQRLAKEAQTLALTVQELYEKASGLAKNHSDELLETLQDMRRGRDVLLKYGSQPPRDAHYLDRKA